MHFCPVSTQHRTQAGSSELSPAQGYMIERQRPELQVLSTELKGPCGKALAPFLQGPTVYIAKASGYQDWGQSQV